MKDDELLYVETEIKNKISSIENTFYHEFLNFKNKEELEEYPGYTKDWIKNSIQDLYYLIKVYLEVKNLDYYLDDFHKKFDSLVINQKEELLNTKQYNPESEPEIKIINTFKTFLFPFKTFNNNTNEEEITKLINVLKSTDYILKNTKAKFVREADIYKQVKWVLDIYYPKTKLANQSSFIQYFKKYNPDILIPELSTAIEYKYIKYKNQNIDDYIDAIKVDSINYVGDSKYDNFIAVLYIKNSGITTVQKIQLAWEQKFFPTNWNLVIVMGS